MLESTSEDLFGRIQQAFISGLWANHAYGMVLLTVLIQEYLALNIVDHSVLIPAIKVINALHHPNNEKNVPPVVKSRDGGHNLVVVGEFRFQAQPSAKTVCFCLV